MLRFGVDAVTFQNLTFRMGMFAGCSRGSGFARWPRATFFLLREKKEGKESTPWLARPAAIGGES